MTFKRFVCRNSSAPLYGQVDSGCIRTQVHETNTCFSGDRFYKCVLQKQYPRLWGKAIQEKRICHILLQCNWRAGHNRCETACVEKISGTLTGKGAEIINAGSISKRGRVCPVAI